MTNNFKDRSNYFKGLLLLVGADKIITDEETKLLTSIGKTLGFEKRFIKEVINDYLENEYISHEPPKFSQTNYAKAFIKDGIRLALADNELQSVEVEWLKKTADENSIPLTWVDNYLNKYLSNRTALENTPLEIEKFFNPSFAG